MKIEDIRKNGLSIAEKLSLDFKQREYSRGYPLGFKIEKQRDETKDYMNRADRACDKIMSMVYKLNDSHNKSGNESDLALAQDLLDHYETCSKAFFELSKRVKVGILYRWFWDKYNELKTGSFGCPKEAARECRTSLELAEQVKGWTEDIAEEARILGC